MKLPDAKSLSVALALAGLMAASAYVNAGNNMKAIVDGELVQPDEATSSIAASPGKGGVLVCEDYNRDGLITFEECTFTEE